MTIGEKKLEFYKSLYKQMVQLDNLYKNYFSLKKIKVDMITACFTQELDQRQQEFNELVTLQTVILSTLIGLNREKLEQANSDTEDRSLFKYKDYESTMKIFFSDESYKDAYEVSKKTCEVLDFNPTKEGPFPYMLEVIQDDGKKRPYDYISKIRNALLHSEYYLETPEILHIQNHDDDGNLTFDAKLLMFSFSSFVIDFFGINTLNSSFPLYEFLDMKEFKNKDDILTFLEETRCYQFKFTKIPESYTFSGKDSLYTRLNNCFKLDSTENKDVLEELETLEKEGFEIQAFERKLSKEQIKNVYNYINHRYKNLFNDENTVNSVSALLKLQFLPTNEITNCLGNIITYMSFKKEMLVDGKLSNEALLNELQYDEYCDTAFLYTMALLKTQVINYAIECEEFEDIDFNKVDTLKLVPDNQTEFDRRKELYKEQGMNSYESKNKVNLETIRNSIAHGGDRIKVSIEPGLLIYLQDIYHKTTPLGVITDLNTLNKVVESKAFHPDNIKIKDTPKIKKK